MMVLDAERLRVLSHLPGRVRLHLPGWAGYDVEGIEALMLGVPGVRTAQANQLTGNILVHFDHRAVDVESLLAKLNERLRQMPEGERSASAGLSSSAQSKIAGCSPLRVVLRALLGHALVDSLWFGAGFLGSAAGLPLAGLGPLHLLMDVAVWTLALAGEQGPVRTPTEKHAAQPRRSAGQTVCTA